MWQGRCSRRHGACMALRGRPWLRPTPQDEAAARIQRCFRAHLADLALRKRSFSKFGTEALALIRQCALPLSLPPRPRRATGMPACSRELHIQLVSTLADRRYVVTGQSGRGLYEEDIVVKARLVLHFDINKTVCFACSLCNDGCSVLHCLRIAHVAAPAGPAAGCSDGLEPSARRVCRC